MTIEQEVNLLDTTDAKLWAKEFVRIFPQYAEDEELFFVWFANSIQTGITHEYWKHHDFKTGKKKTEVEE